MVYNLVISAADREEKKKHKRSISDVAVVYGEVVLEEVFDVKLYLVILYNSIRIGTATKFTKSLTTQAEVIAHRESQGANLALWFYQASTES